jgi:uncharacterized integral membrane protein
MILLLVLAAITIVFIVQNVSVIEIRFLFWSVSMSGALLVFLFITTGIVIGWMLSGLDSHRKKKQAPPES